MLVARDYSLVSSGRGSPEIEYDTRRIEMSSTPGCPVCDAEVQVAADTVVDELLECDDCGCELVVTALDPVAFEEAPMAEEDWGE
jgi:alpha-aminoadipate carrier protein LysW